MSYYSFKCEEPKVPMVSGAQSFELQIETVSLTDLLQAFDQFLKGSGFHFEGQVGIVDEEA